MSIKTRTIGVSKKTKIGGIVIAVLLVVGIASFVSKKAPEPVSETARAAVTTSAPAPVTTSVEAPAPATTSAPVQITTPASPPAAVVPVAPATSIAEDRVVPLVHTTNAGANSAVDTMYSDCALLVTLYNGTGQHISVDEMDGINTAAVTGTTATSIVNSFISAGAYSDGQLSAISEMATAGEPMANAVGGLMPDSVVNMYWSHFQSAYQDFEAAS